MLITSTSNSKIRKLIQIRDKNRVRRAEKCFLTEGVKMFLEAPPEIIREIYVSESFLHSRQMKACEKKIKAMQYIVVSDEIFRKISDTVNPQGIMCILQEYNYSLQDILQKPHFLTLILEDLQDPGNLGTIIRTGEGAGVTGVIMSRDTVDIYNPKTIRSTMGSIYRMPFVYTDSIGEAVAAIKSAGGRVYAAHLEGSVPHTEPSYKEGTAFMIGNEGNGLTEETAGLADQFIRIPMKGRVESLNAAMAAGILMYEAARQRELLRV